MPNFKRIIEVAKEHRASLQEAANAVNAARTVYDAYQFVKDYLNARRVPHQDKTVDLQTHNSQGHFWHP